MNRSQIDFLNFKKIKNKLKEIVRKEDEMDPGPKLDALIAEHVMGLEPWPEQKSTWKVKAFKAPIVPYGIEPKPCEPPEYSTDITAAWTVVEKIRDDNFELQEHGTHWKARFGIHWRGAETVPHAICLAALSAAGIEI